METYFYLSEPIEKNVFQYETYIVGRQNANLVNRILIYGLSLKWVKMGALLSRVGSWLVSKVVADNNDLLTQSRYIITLFEWVNSGTIFFDTNYFELLLVRSSLQFPDFQSQFSTSKIILSFLFFFIEEYHFRCTFFIIDIFENFNF
jgi:hypothetical protein